MTWGARGLELRTADLHSVSSPGRAYQVVHKSQMSPFEVVGAFLIIHASEKLQYIIIGSGLLLNRYRIVLVCIAMHRRND